MAFPDGESSQGSSSEENHVTHGEFPQLSLHVLGSCKAVTKYLICSLLTGKGGLLWIMLSDVSLFVCLLVLGRACSEDHGVEAVHFMVNGKLRGRGKGWPPNIPFNSMSPETQPPPCIFHLLVPPPPRITTDCLSSLSHMSICGMFASKR